MLGMAFLLLLTACESSAVFRVVNVSSYPAYARVEDGSQVTIPAGATYDFDIDTDTQSIFTGEVTKDVKVWLVGETYNLFDPDTGRFVDSTWITVSAGKTLSAYLNPNRASVKITNQSSQNIVSADIWQHGAINHLQMGTFANIEPGESRFLRVPYPTGTASFYYDVTLVAENGANYTYGNSSNVLGKDQQFHVIFTD